MKIAISVVEPSLDSEVFPRFGRSRYFIVIDLETMQYESVTNPNIESSSGAGIGTAQLVFKKGASVVITGSIGPKAQQVFAAAGVRMLTGVNGSARDAIAEYKAGKLFVNAEAGAGIEEGAGMQRGPGMGSGMGMGMRSGKGMGSGMGMGMRSGKGMGCGMGCGGGKGMGMGAGRGGGRGQGSGQGGQRGGRLGDSRAGRPADTCVCPQCGQSEPQERGAPCYEHKCPKCGTAMTSQ